MLLATVATLVSLVFNVSAGYAFAKLRFAGRDRIFKLLLGALVIPGQVAMVPLFLLLKHMGLVNSYGGVIVPAMASIFGIFLVRQYALSIPNELLEAARIDGASEFRIFRIDRGAAAEAHHRDARGLYAARDMERLHVAADRAHRQAISTPCPSPSPACRASTCRTTR